MRSLSAAIPITRSCSSIRAARGNYAGGYYRFHNTEIFDAANQGWINSGNSDLHGPPLGPNSSRDAILNDIIDAESTHVWHNHIGGFDPVFRGSAAEIVANAWRTENNVAYSDGHVETHGNSYMVTPDNPSYAIWAGANWVLRAGFIRILF